MKIFIFFLVLIYCNPIFAQDSEKSNPGVLLEFEKKIESFSKESNLLKLKTDKLEIENKNLTKDVELLKRTSDSLSSNMRILNNQYESVKQELSKANKELDTKVNDSEKLNDVKFSNVKDSLERNTLYWILAFLTTALISTLFYLFISRRQKTDKNYVISQLNITKNSIEENLVTEYSKLTELMKSQLELEKQKFISQQKNDIIEPDHSLALKVADEITLIERNLKYMDVKTKGLKQLSASVRKLKDNLAANGYEIQEMLGKKYHEGMKVIVSNSVPDDSLEPGQEIISKILKPQVNYNSKMIQAAQIEVSIG